MSVLIFSLILCACKGGPYKTTYDKAKISGIQTKKICILSFSSSPDFNITNGGFLKAETKSELAKGLNNLFLSSFVNQFKKYFDLSEADGDTISKNIDIADNKKIAALIERNNSDIGVIVNNQYSWGNSTYNTPINHYIFDSQVSMFDKDGSMIWQFSSKGYITPSPSLSLILTDLSDEKIQAAYAEFFAFYPDIIYKLILEDISGKPHGKKFKDYIEYKKLLPKYELTNK
jgi:hypothetical protein